TSSSSPASSPASRAAAVAAGSGTIFCETRLSRSNDEVEPMPLLLSVGGGAVREGDLELVPGDAVELGDEVRGDLHAAGAADRRLPALDVEARQADLEDVDAVRPGQHQVEGRVRHELVVELLGLE